MRAPQGTDRLMGSRQEYQGEQQHLGGGALISCQPRCKAPAENEPPWLMQRGDMYQSKPRLEVQCN